MKLITGHSTAFAIVFAALIYAWINHYSFKIDGEALSVTNNWTGTFSRCLTTQCKEHFPPRAE